MVIKNNLSEKFKECTGNDFDTYYKKYQPKLVWFLRSKCKDHDDAEDLATMTWMRAFDKIDSYNKVYQFSTWLFTIGARLFYDEYRKNIKHPKISMDQDYDGVTLKEMIPADESKIGEMKLIDIKASIIKEKIYTLPAKYKAVLIMRELEGMKYDEIAEELQINLSTIKSQIRTGRQILVKMVEKEFEALEEIN